MLTTVEILSNTLCVNSQNLKGAVLRGHYYSNYTILEDGF